MMTQPSRAILWRIVLGLTSVLAVAAVIQALAVANRLGIHVLGSKSWVAILGAMALVAIAAALMLALTWTDHCDGIFALLELAERLRGTLRWLGLLIFIGVLIFFPIFYYHPYFTNIFSGQAWIVLFVFWASILVAMQALKIAWPYLSWFATFLVSALFLGCIQRIVGYFPDVSMYPFAMSWSETSRFYYPSLFVSSMVFGQRFPWPILHPSLHLLLVPPYLLDLPLWFHRAWQVGIRFLLVGLIAPALLYRLKLESKSIRWLLGVWIFLFLFTDGIYLHLAVPVFAVLWGFSAEKNLRTWLVVILASLWSGISRINWYPVPALLAAVLYFLEVPLHRQKLWRYLLKPAAWFIVGTALAFAIMRLYIAESGIGNPLYFYTSLSSTLLWYRLWPNASYFLGVLPGILLFSLPVFLVIALTLTRQRGVIHSVRLIVIGLVLLALFGGGILVSMKIGGGTDIHNLDAYACVLLVVGTYLIFGRYGREDGEPASMVVLPWSLVALLVLIPAWFNLHIVASFIQYDPAEAQATLSALQQRVDKINSQGGEILFITQRHLISMHMLQGVTLVPEYEREELMEMAMSNNQNYLASFRQDIQNQRFAAIIVDPLKYNLLGPNDADGDENNVWVRRVAKPILCYYRPDETFAADHIVIYVPQGGPSQCPK